MLQGVLFGISGGLLYVPVIKLLPEWFSERRGLAGGIIFAGGGVGGGCFCITLYRHRILNRSWVTGFLFPFALTALLDKVGLQWTLRIWAIVTTIFCGIALLGLRPRLPVPKYPRGSRRPRFIPPQLGFVKNPLFWSVVCPLCVRPSSEALDADHYPDQSVTILLQGFSYFPVSLYIASFTTAITSPFTATIVLSVFNSSAVGGQILLGHLSDRFPYPWVMCASAVGSSVVAFLLWGFARAPIQLYFFAVIFGALVRALVSASRWSWC